MYLEFFGLREHPFRLTPDADFLFMSRAHARAKAYMDYTVLSRDGFVVVTGDIGSGKTTLLNKLLDELPDDVVVAKIFQTQLNEIEFLQAVLAEFGEPANTTSKVELLNTLNDFLIDCYRRNERALLIVDEAQNLSEKVLEEIRLLSGLETNKDKLISIILSGQPELAELVDAPHMEQLAQRVRLRFHLTALSEDETRDYIRHRLDVAGYSGEDLFDEEAYAIIYEYSGGVPRLINSVCDMALLSAYVDESPTVTPRIVRSAIEELGWVPFHERPTQVLKTKKTAVAMPLLPVAGEDGGAPALAAASALTAEISEKVTRLHDFVPRMSAGLMGKMRLIEEQLKDLTRELKSREFKD